MSLGPTGDFPRGKFSADDDGALTIAVAHKDNTVIIRFGTEVSWIGLDADGAIGLAEVLIDHARKCGSTKPLTLNIGGKRG